MAPGTFAPAILARWSLKIGDPTVAGWVITIAYLLAAAACFRAMRLARRRGPLAGRPRGLVFWACLGALLLALGINKQLDLQMLLADWGRQLAREQGWYAQRREFQRRFILALAACGGILLAWLAWRIRHARWPCWLALAGAILQVIFILVRAVSLHHVDHLLGMRWLTVKMHAWLELSGIALIGSAGLISAASKPRAAGNAGPTTPATYAGAGPESR
jgi:hypothetical protein